MGKKNWLQLGKLNKDELVNKQNKTFPIKKHDYIIEQEIRKVSLYKWDGESVF